MEIEESDTREQVDNAPHSCRHRNNTSASARTSDDDREATELGHVNREPSVASGSPADDQEEVLVTQSPAPDRVQQPPPRWYDKISRFWKRYIQLAVPHADCRDHLANERTFLAYQRTSVALSMIGIVTTQLFNLQRRQDSHASFGYFVLSKPIGVLFQLAAIFVTVIGAHRCWRQQMNMARGRVQVGGWEVYAIMGTFLLLLVLVFSLLIAVDINKESR